MGKRKEFANPEKLEAASPPTGIIDIDSLVNLEILHAVQHRLCQGRLKLDEAPKLDRTLGQELVSRTQRGEDTYPLAPIKGHHGVMELRLETCKEIRKVGIRLDGGQHKRKRRKREVVDPPHVSQIDASGVSTVPGVFESGVNWEMVGKMADHVLRMLGRR